MRFEDSGARLHEIERLKAMNAAFTNEQFGEYKPMIGEGSKYKKSPYPAPPVYPKRGEHPRFLMTPKLLPRIKEMLCEPLYKNIKENLERTADTDIHDGIFPEELGKLGGLYRYSPEVLTAIDSKAFMYMLTGDELYALEAIVGIKNAMLTLKFTKDIHGDTYHGASHVLIVLCTVIDRCHDYLTDADKEQFLRGAVSKMMPCLEFSYPPDNQGYISGHGTGPQFLRDFMCLATAFYDEAPDWWEFVAGRYFYQHLPIANVTFGKGWVSQGTGNYAYNKLLVQLWAAALVYNATGTNPLDDGAAKGIYFLISHAMPSGLYFYTGDGGRGRTGAPRSVEFGSFFMTASLFDDPVAFANARDMSDGFKKYLGSFSSTMTPSMQISLLSRVHYNGEGARDGVGLIQYFDYPACQMSARTSWTDENAAVIMMKIGGMNMGNHDHSDHGTFQIYYKGLLACSSGGYRKYHSDHHKWYQKATVSANGLLVFNPSKVDAEPIYGEVRGDIRVLNAERYYYSGSQRFIPESGTREVFLGGDYDIGVMSGAFWGYNADGSANFGYVAGDITNAYPKDTVTKAARRMLTVFTGREDIPMLFFTFDTLGSTDPEFEKTFLLHTAEEPIVDEEALSATVTVDGGKLVYKGLYGFDKIEKIGGHGKAFWINGKNLTDKYMPDDKADIIWGRIEAKTSGRELSQMLSCMYVTDKDGDARASFTGFESETAYAATALDTVAIFAKGEPYANGDISITVEGGGLYRYYVSGVSDGEWRVFVDGVPSARLSVKPGEGCLTFTAPAGDILLKNIL